MAVIADILLIAGALGVAAYCFVLSRRLKNLTGLDSGMGGAIAVLSSQVDDLTKTLTKTQESAARQEQNLAELSAKAADAAKRLELLMAAMHDLPDAPGAAPAPPPATEAEAPTVFVRSRDRGSLSEAAE